MDNVEHTLRLLIDEEVKQCDYYERVRTDAEAKYEYYRRRRDDLKEALETYQKYHGPRPRPVAEEAT